MPNLSFTVDSALLSELGEKLVENVHIALIELVKNSYDADATEVHVKFNQQKKGGLEIEIIDNGTGMSLEDVQNYWMRIATTSKVIDNKSRLYGRPKTGSKGIGRFSCRRLGDTLKLITISQKGKKSFEKTEVLFPWRKFKAGTEVTAIRCQGKNEIISKAKTGTTLIITGGPANEWQQRKYEFLKRQLAILVSNRGTKRLGFKEDPGFNIFLDAPQFEGKIKDLRDEFISGGWATLTGSVTKNGTAKYHLNALGIGQKSMVLRGKFPDLAGVRLRIGIIPVDKEFIRNRKLLTKTILKEILPEWGGVQIRFNGFRVYPYGDDDWLGIDRDRARRLGKPKERLFAFAEKLKGVDPSRSLLSLLSMRNHVGNVEIGPQARGFELKASREGFLQSKSFDDLREFVRSAIDWATIYRDYYIRSKLKERTIASKEHLEKILKKSIEPEKLVETAVDYIREEIRSVSDVLPQKKKRNLEKSLEKASDAILEHDKANRRELHHLRLIASTSTLLFIFSHEVKSLLGMLSSNIGALKNLGRRFPKKDKLIIKEIENDLYDTKERFSELLEMTALVGYSTKGAKPELIALKDRIETAIRCFQLIIQRYKISIDFSEVPNNLMVGPILEAELYAILLNVISNSIKSMVASGGRMQMEIVGWREKRRSHIIFNDSGIGIDEKYFEEVFTPYVADPGNELYKRLESKLNPEDEYIVGTGSGLGLSIIREIIQVRKGTITFRKSEGKWKASLKVTLP